jgi:general stress protein 26
MMEIPGLLEGFKKARVVFLTTYTDVGEEHNRKMTNLNEDPYSSMWFPTYTNTTKVKEVSRNPKAFITFPAEKRGEFYEIEGKADVETGDEVERKWFWWYLYWRPSQRNRFWFPGKDKHPEWAIINFHPVSARLVKKIN